MCHVSWVEPTDVYHKKKVLRKRMECHMQIFLTCVQITQEISEIPIFRGRRVLSQAYTNAPTSTCKNIQSTSINAENISPGTTKKQKNDSVLQWLMLLC